MVFIFSCLSECVVLIRVFLPLVWSSFPCLISLTVIPGVDSRSSAFYGVVLESRHPIMHWFSSLYVSGERRRSCPAPVRQPMASRYSTSSVSSFSGAPLRPRLHSQFQEESSIRFSRYHGDTLDQSSWVESTGGYQGYQGDEECFGGYHGERQYTQAGNQIDWSLGDDIQGNSGSRVGVVRAMGDSYFLSADVSGFEPHEVVLLAYNQCVVIHAEKMAADGSVAGRFTHKSVLPADMDPLSVSSSLTAERMLIISVGRRKSPPSSLKLTSDLPGSQHSSCYCFFFSLSLFYPVPFIFFPF
ncbi:Heat shock protein beta-7 [Labeo rohita]|uniref:Heat shock protein beta-7 n=1 Tax=Labeo rohita TaxID=84645 RepID=A0ABQ8M0R9_LABRO|nr:Heat shock protein beta-7 [Labeo rohita]